MTVLNRRAILVGLASTLMPGAALAASAHISFILTNDIYQMNAVAMPDGKTRGGFARLAAVVKAERAKGGHVIFAHAGDTLSPSLMSGLDRGAHIVALTNMIPPDIFAPGNHEFDFGKAVFFERMAEAKFPVYAANLRGPDGKPLPNIRDRAIVTIGGVRIGLTGITLDTTPHVSSPGDLQFLPSVATTKQQADALRKEGADFVVAVVHADRKQDYEIAATRSVDLLLSGHDHDLFFNFDGRSAIVESSYDAHYVAIVDAHIEIAERDGRRIVAWWPQVRIIDTANVTPDAEVAAMVAKYEAELSRELDVPLAKLAVELDSRNASVRTREAAIGNLIADAMRASAKADVALMNGGGIRGGKVYPSGSDITRRNVLAELPFGNRLVTLNLTGRDLRSAIENGLAQLPDAGGRFPHVSGLRVEADLKRKPGARIVAIRVGLAQLVDTRVYRVATNDFVARGGDNYAVFQAATPLLPPDDSPLLANEVMVHIRSLGTVRTGVEGRVVLR